MKNIWKLTKKKNSCDLKDECNNVKDLHFDRTQFVCHCQHKYPGSWGIIYRKLECVFFHYQFECILLNYSTMFLIIWSFVNVHLFGVILVGHWVRSGKMTPLVIYQILPTYQLIDTNLTSTQLVVIVSNTDVTWKRN